MKSPATQPETLQIDPDCVPRHVAIIMDGNGRWAKARGLPRSAGHREGARSVRKVVTRARERGVEVLTMYAFSAQNWSRTEAEIEGLMTLLIEFCEGERDLLMDQGIRFQTIGQRERLPEQTLAAVQALEAVTAANAAMTLVVALSYGGREEIVAAARNLAKQVADGEMAVDDIDEATFADALTTGQWPDPDLLIRTGGDVRVSNFLLWQIAYAEFVIEPSAWPDYDGDALDRALLAFGKRQRRFGGVVDVTGKVDAPRPGIVPTPGNGALVA